MTKDMSRLDDYRDLMTVHFLPFTACTMLTFPVQRFGPQRGGAIDAEG